MSTRQRRALGIAALMVSGAVMAGCSANQDGADSASASAASPTPPAIVTVYGPATGDRQAQLEAAWQDWASGSNITIQYTGDPDFAANVATKTQGAAAPDIVIFPQPDLMQTALAAGNALPLDDTTLAAVQQNFTASWQGFGTYQGQQYAVPLDATAKGFIWYQPSQFTNWGVGVPSSWDDLMTLTQTIQSATGTPPWCVGFGTGGSADGQPGADQIAEYVLSADGADFYNQWVAGQVPFTDPKIKDAFNALGAIWTNKKYVNAGFSGTSSIATTQSGDVAAPLANGTCALTNQDTSLEPSLNSATTAAGSAPVIGPDGDVWAFAMPPVTGSTSLMGSGDFAVAFADRQEVTSVMAYLASGEFATSLVAVPNAGFLTANQAVYVSSEPDPLLAMAITALVDPSSTFAIDAYSSMPPAVQTAWAKGMVDWVKGAKLDTVLKQIQAAWPTS